MAEYVVKLTMEQALKLGIVVCANCGWPPNNHFSTINPPRPGESACAHDKCPGYKVKFRMGTAI